MPKKFKQGPQSVKRSKKKGAKKRIKSGVPNRALRAAQREGRPSFAAETILPIVEDFGSALPSLPKLLARKSSNGRPDTYTPELATEILQRIASGETLTSVCCEVGMPHATTVLKWVMRDGDFKKAYDLARLIQADVWADQTQDIADNIEELSKVQETVGGKDGGKTVTTTEDAIEHRKLKIDNRRWLIARSNPLRYGDRTQIESRNLNLNVTKIEMVRVDTKGKGNDASS